MPRKPKKRAANKKAQTRRHHVSVKTPPSGLTLGKGDVRFDVLDREGKIGTLLISVGAIEWKPFNSPIRRKYSWEAFDRCMVEGKRRVR
ncbi:MAG: hypothetical protein ABR552_06255 [Actinomycetota bacterium]